MSETKDLELKTGLQHGDFQHSEVEAERRGSHAYDLDKTAKVSDYKAGAIEAENAEHNMTVLEAVRAYPMASFWAFVMSFTIVGCLFPSSVNLSADQESQLNHL